MGLAEIKNDSKLNRQRIAEMDFSKMDRADLAKFIKTELADNVWPYLEGLVEAVQDEHKKIEEEVEALDAAVEELEQGDEEALFPETAQQILGVLQLGQQIAIDLAPALAKGTIDEVRKKKLARMVKAYRQGAEVVAQMVVALIVKPDEDGESGAADDDDDEVTPEAGPGDVDDDADDAADGDADYDPSGGEG